MLMEVEKCISCGKMFTFDTAKCSQVIVKPGDPDAFIIFLPECTFCGELNKVQVSWEKYGRIDY